MTAALYAGVALTAALSCAWDLRLRRIPNLLTVGSAAAACCVHLALSGPAGAGFSVAGWVLGIALFLPWFLARAMGGGDVKLLGAVGAWLGPVEIVWACLFAMAAGGVVALVLLAAPRRERPRAIAYAVPVTMGVALALWLR